MFTRLAYISLFTFALAGCSETPVVLNPPPAAEVQSQETLCSEGSLRSCVDLGAKAEAKADLTAQIRYLEKACDLKSSKQCEQLGEINLARGYFANAETSFIQSCQMDSNSNSCFRVAQLERVKGNTPSAVGYLKVACQEKNAESCYLLGKVQSDAGMPMLASWFYTQACQLESSDGCLQGARMEFQARHSAVSSELLATGCRQNQEGMCELKDWLNTAQEKPQAQCQIGDADACFSLAQMTLITDKKTEVSDLSYQRACKLGKGDACYHIAMNSWYSLDLQTFRQFAKQSCALGVSQACLSVGDDLYYQADLTGAANSYQLACTAGDENGCDNYGKIALKAGEISLPIAVAEFDHACSPDNLSACFWSLRMKTSMDASDEEKSASLLKFQQLCDQGHGNACRLLASQSQAAGNADEAFNYDQKGCKLNNENACLASGIYQEKKGNTTEAHDLIDRACDLNSAQACAYLQQYKAEDNKS